MTPRKVDKSAKREHIRLAALNIFAQKGLQNTRMIDIAQAADCGKTTLYDYYPGKDELTSEALGQVFESFVSNLKAELPAHSSAADKLAGVSSQIQQVYTESQIASGNLFAEFWAAAASNYAPHSALALQFRAVYRYYLELIATLFSDGITQGIFRNVDAEAFASAYLALHDGIYLQWLLEQRSFAFADRVNSACDLFLKQFQKSEAEKDQ
jgi:AcrR family transcriptional regulator